MEQRTCARPTGGDFVGVALGTIRARDGIPAALRAAEEMIAAASGIVARECGHEHLVDILEQAAECARIVVDDI